MATFENTLNTFSALSGEKRSTEVNVKNYSNHLRVYFHQIHVSWSELVFIQIYFCCGKLIEH